MEIIPTYYAVIPATVRYDKRLKPNEKLLYGELVCLTQQKGYCWASNQYFAELYDCDKSTISRWISNLSQCGYLDIIIRRDENQKIIERKIYIKDNFPERNTDPIDYLINTPIDEQTDTLLTKKSIPYTQKNQYPIDEKVKENNIKENTTSLINSATPAANSVRPSANAEVSTKQISQIELKQKLKEASLQGIKVWNEGNIYHFPVCDVIVNEEESPKVEEFIYDF